MKEKNSIISEIEDSQVVGNTKIMEITHNKQLSWITTLQQIFDELSLTLNNCILIIYR